MDKAGRVLVVDDEPVVRNLIQAVLTAEGYTVLDANAYEEAMAICEALDSQGIQLLVVDHGLPPKNGKALASQILKRCPNAKVLMISGWPFEVVVAQDGLLPGARFLPKPFTSQALKKVVAEILMTCVNGHCAGQ